MPGVDRLSEYATATPTRRAVQVGTEIITYEALRYQAKRVSDALSLLPQKQPGRHGLPRDGRLLAASLGNHIRFPEIFVGATTSPHAIAVLDPKMPASQLKGILPRLSPDIVVADSPTSPVFEIAREFGIRAVSVAGAHSSDFSYEGWLASASPMELSNHIDHADGPFLVGLTSGTTSLPKAFIRKRSTWRGALRLGREVFSLTSSTNTIAPGSMAHGVALYALAEALDVGGEFHVFPSFQPENVIAALEAGQAQRMVIVPTMIQALANVADHKALTFPGILQIVTAAAKFESHHLEAARRIFPNAEIQEYYGASELGFVAVGKIVDGANTADEAVSSVGRPFPTTKVTIRDETGRELPTGEVGTIFLESDLIATGYLWGDDGLSFRKTEFGATVGDMGFLNEAGLLSVVGRAGSMIISSGHNIYLAEIETALKKMPMVSDAVAFGLPDSYSGQRLVAVVSSRDGSRMRKQDLLAWCAAHLPKYKFPRELYRIENWPMTTSGKIARGQVEQWITSGSSTVERLDD